jgi:AraC-like DNA-binding protein
MIGCGVANFTDPDEFGASVPGVAISLVLTEPGEFRGQVTWVKLPQLGLFRWAENLSHVAFVSTKPGPVFISFPARSNVSAFWQGIEIEQGEIVVHGRDSPVCLRTKRDYQWGSIEVEPKVLENCAATIGLRAFAPTASTRFLKPPRDAVSSMLLLHGQACRLVETKSALVTHCEVARAFEQDLLYAMAQCLASEEAHCDSGAKQNHAEIMARVEETLAAHETTPITAPQLAAAVGAPERTVQACCAEFLGMSPGQYARVRRLHLVRKALRRADPTAASVSAIARQYGFRELGRLAAAYRTAFGETPSSTLHSLSKKIRPSAESA